MDGKSEDGGRNIAMKTSPPTSPSPLLPVMTVVSPSLRGWNSLDELLQPDLGVEGHRR